MLPINNDIEINAIVKKHKAIINCENSLPLASRKIFNILLFLVKDRFGKDLEHQVFETDVLELLKKTDRDITSARINFKKLASTVIEYNILNTDKDHLNGVGTMLAPAVINTTKKIWCFSFPPNIVQWVQDPNSFVFLDITTQEKYSSKYSQALWEICIGSLENQNESYFSVTLDECRILMCGKENHLPYKDFKRRVVLVALREINEKSILQVELFKECKEGRSVNELVFFVRRQNDEKPVLQILDNDLYIKMVEEFGITAHIAKKLINEFPEEQILINLEYTEQQYRKSIKEKKDNHFNLGAYATSAITKDYAPKKPKLLKKVNEEKLKLKENNTKLIALEKVERDNFIIIIQSVFDKLDARHQNSLKLEFEKTGLKGPIKNIFQNGGWGNQKVLNQFFAFLAFQLKIGKKGDGYDHLNSLM